MEELEREMKILIVEALMLDDVTADEIESEASLFVDGLGLDSIDALELAMPPCTRFAIRQNSVIPANAPQWPCDPMIA
jgi:acyl carrier protein